MPDARTTPPFPGPNGPPGDTEPLRRVTLDHVNEADLRAIAAADYGMGEARVLDALRIPRRLGRWPTIADTDDGGRQLHECGLLVLTATEHGLGGDQRWRLLFAAGVVVHLTHAPGYRGEPWTDLRLAQMLILAMELGPQAAGAVRPFIAWMRERPPADGFGEPHDYDLPLLLLDAATGGGPPMTNERVIDLCERVRTFYESSPADDDDAPYPERALWSNWFDDPAALGRHVAARVRAMAPADPCPAMAELLASKTERREPRF